MLIGIIGINHKLADLKLREALAKACQTLFSPDRSLHPQLQSVLLSTCNRTEIYFSSEELSETHTYLLSILRKEIKEDFDQKLYSYFGVDCFMHLIRVAAGLDSAIIAETEIQGQVKVAYETATHYQRLSRDLHLLFQKSLSAAKKIRCELHFENDIPQIEHAILSTGRQFFRSLKGASVLFVGVSEINQKILKYLLGKQIPKITLCNRTHSSAEQMAEKHPIELLKWPHLKTQWHHYDWIILGTKSPEFLITKDDCPQALNDKKLIMDLSVPRNIDPLIKRNSHINLLNIDELNRSLKIRKQTLKQGLEEAEAMAKHFAEQYFSRLKREYLVESIQVTA